MCGWARSSQFWEDRDQWNGGLGGGKGGCIAKTRAEGGPGTLESEHSRARQGPGFKMGRAVLSLGSLSPCGQMACLSSETLRLMSPCQEPDGSIPGPRTLPSLSGQCGKRVLQHPLLLVMHGHSTMSATHPRAAGVGPLASGPSSERPLGSSLSLDPLTGAQVTPSLLHCSSVPGTKKETPLMLKIHFKLLPTSSPREMTKRNQ